MHESLVRLAGDGLALALMCVFGISAVAKLSSLARFRAALAVTYAFPRRSATVLSVGVPLVELAIAASLLIGTTRPVGLVAAIGFLGSVLITVGSTLLAGRNGDCGCFGALRTERVGLGTVIRAASLLVIAILALLTILPAGAPQPPASSIWQVVLAMSPVVLAALLGAAGLRFAMRVRRVLRE